MRTLSLALAGLLAFSACDSNDPEVRIGDAVDPANASQCLSGEVTVEDVTETQAQAAFPTATVVVDYTGTLALASGETETFDTTVGDDGVSRPATFPLGGVVPGFRQGIGGREATDDLPGIDPMRIGERRRITIPPNLGYGYAGRYNSAGDHVIPRCATLEFDVTLRDLL